MQRIVNSLVDQEIVLLYAVIHALRNMNNRQIFEIYGQEEKQIMFHNDVARDLYFILLSDFLSKMRKEYRLGGDAISSFDALLDLTKNPLLGSKDLAQGLETKLMNFKDWLSYEAVIEKMWFPNVDKEVDLKISREAMVRICGNLNKHNFLQLKHIVEWVKEIFAANDICLTDEQGIMCLEHFQEWFNENILIYHSSFIAEMLIGIEWSILEYLTPLYKKSLNDYWDHKLKLNRYKFEFPEDLEVKTGSFVHHMLWGVMNLVRGKPIFPQFVVGKHFKTHY